MVCILAILLAAFRRFLSLSKIYFEKKRNERAARRGDGTAKKSNCDLDLVNSSKGGNGSGFIKKLRDSYNRYDEEYKRRFYA